MEPLDLEPRIDSAWIVLAHPIMDFFFLEVYFRV